MKGDDTKWRGRLVPGKDGRAEQVEEVTRMCGMKDATDLFLSFSMKRHRLPASPIFIRY